MNRFLVSGITLFISTIIFAHIFLTVISDSRFVSIWEYVNYIYVTNFAIWILSIILSSIDMKIQRKEKQQKAIFQEKRGRSN